ncbi:HXXXD-type acyl-transferase family protein [Striga asiatica]|uniref:HXXXD-type acyl-transferase family protein n=1 Tax=Striga asiatica TaxID=4170 RepID=A0A5A7RA57_STRAF|nr:HXXXD-type acyl-transferase family protein [Striga asiatica]
MKTERKSEESIRQFMMTHTLAPPPYMLPQILKLVLPYRIDAFFSKTRIIMKNGDKFNPNHGEARPEWTSHEETFPNKPQSPVLTAAAAAAPARHLNLETYWWQLHG